MAKKLSLGPESSFSKSITEQKHEYGSQLKASQGSCKRPTCRKEKSDQHSPPDGCLQASGSQEQLDSGLGSIDSQLMEGPWSDHLYGVNHSSQQYYPPRGAPYRSCPHGPFSEGTTSAHHQRCSCGCGSSHGSDVAAHGPGHYTGYAGYPVSMHEYSHRHWSDPFCSRPWVVQNRPAEQVHWGPPQVERQTPPSGLKDREAIRKKLLAIFSAHMVDAAMTRFPELMDPELLVAQILMLQSQSRLLR